MATKTAATGENQNTGSDAENQDQTGSDAENHTTVSLAEYEKARKARDWATGKLRTLEKQFEALQQQIADSEMSDADASKNLEKLKEIAAKREDKLNKELESWKKRATDTLIERDVLQMASKLVTRPEVLLSLTRDQYEIGEDENGRSVVQLRNGGGSLKEFIERFVNDTIPELKINPRKGGTGAAQSGQRSDAESDYKLSDLGAMTPEQRQKVLAENEGLRHAALNQFFPMKR